MTDCPSLRELLGAIESDDDVLLEHAVGCQRCRRLIDGQVAEMETWRRLLRTNARSLADSGPSPPNVDVPRPENTPVRLDAYELVERIGAGGMGVVYRARDTLLDRDVAVKIVRTAEEPTARERFVREARAAARVAHDHVVPVHAVGSPEDGPPYLVMPYVRGRTLQDRLSLGEPLGPRETAEIVAQVADGLAAVHACGLVHRDVKPGNVLLDDSTGRALLTDFGVARGPDDSPLTEPDVLPGTPEYTSPEQIRDGEVDAHSDVFALGVTLYQCLVGTLPFVGTPHAVLRQIVEVEPRPPRVLDRSVPRDLETICLKALAKDPSERYDSAAAMRDDLRRWLGGEPIRARRPGPIGHALRWARRHPWPVGLALLAMLAATAGLLRERSTERTRSRLTEALVSERSRAASISSEAERLELETLELEREARQRTLEVDQTRGQLLRTVLSTRLLDDPTLRGAERRFLSALRDSMAGYAERQALDEDDEARARAADVRLGVAMLSVQLGDDERAMRELRSAVERFDPASPNLRSRRRGGLALHELGRLLTRNGRADEAVDCLERSLSIRSELARVPGGPHLRLDEIRTRIALGVVRHATGRSTAAVEAFDVSKQELVALESPDERVLPPFRIEVAKTWTMLAGEWATVAGTDTPVEVHRRAMSAWDRLIAEQPRRADLRAACGRSWDQLGIALLEAGSDQRAAGAFRRAVEQLERAVHAVPTAPTYRDDLQSARQHLATAVP